MASDPVMIGWTTIATREQAVDLAQQLVASELAACAQVSGPITSVYRWQGRLETSAEYRIAVKFAAARAPAIEAWWRDHHPYENPQWLYCRADGGLEKYLNWVVGDAT